MAFLKFYKYFFIIISVFILLTSCNAEDKNEDHPNILLLIADDWSWPHAGIYPESDDVVKTPAFDALAGEGVLFNNAFVAAPSCSPSRAAILTGQFPHRLEEAASLYGSFPSKFPVYTQLLEKAGYFVGMTGKGWAPGNFEVSGWEHNPAGKRYKNFESFLTEVPENSPFCFWFGSTDPHRPYKKNSGTESGMDISKVKIPDYFPDDTLVRKDILDYYYEVERFDREVGKVLRILEQSGRLENTLIVMTGDNGWPFPRAKATLYDGGTRVPLAISWKAEVSGGKIINDFVSLMDLAPTFLEAAGLDLPGEMTGNSLVPALKGGKSKIARDKVFTERERHSITREGGVGYPSRALRTEDFLYIRNLKPDRWPAGNVDNLFTDKAFSSVDVDNYEQDRPSTVNFIIDQQLLKGKTEKYPYFKLVFDKRPAEELYDLKKDPWQINNVADKPEYSEMLKKFRKIMNDWMKGTNDPRADERGHVLFDEYPFYGRKN
jgi:arylsulfatase A-like enzyme